MTQRTFIYDVTFRDGLTMPITAANKKLAIMRAVSLRVGAARADIASIERRLPAGRLAPLALYSVRLRIGGIHSGIKLLAHDASAAIAAARHVLAVEYANVPVMDALVMRVIRLGTGYDLSYFEYG